MDIKDGRGQHRKDVEQENRENIIKFFTEYPNGTRTDCSKATGLSLVTIRRHLKEINQCTEGI